MNKLTWAPVALVLLSLVAGGYCGLNGAHFLPDEEIARLEKTDSRLEEARITKALGRSGVCAGKSESECRHHFKEDWGRVFLETAKSICRRNSRICSDVNIDRFAAELPTFTGHALSCLRLGVADHSATVDIKYQKLTLKELFRFIAPCVPAVRIISTVFGFPASAQSANPVVPTIVLSQSPVATKLSDLGVDLRPAKAVLDSIPAEKYAKTIVESSANAIAMTTPGVFVTEFVKELPRFAQPLLDHDMLDYDLGGFSMAATEEFVLHYINDGKGTNTVAVLPIIDLDSELVSLVLPVILLRLREDSMSVFYNGPSGPGRADDLVAKHREAAVRVSAECGESKQILATAITKRMLELVQRSGYSALQRNRYKYLPRSIIDFGKSKLSRFRAALSGDGEDDDEEEEEEEEEDTEEFGGCEPEEDPQACLDRMLELFDDDVDAEVEARVRRTLTRLQNRVAPPDYRDCVYALKYYMDSFTCDKQTFNRFVARRMHELSKLEGMRQGSETPGSLLFGIEREGKYRFLAGLTMHQMGAPAISAMEKADISVLLDGVAAGLKPQAEWLLSMFDSSCFKSRQLCTWGRRATVIRRLEEITLKWLQCAEPQTYKPDPGAAEPCLVFVDTMETVIPAVMEDKYDPNTGEYNLVSAFWSGPKAQAVATKVGFMEDAVAMQNALFSQVLLTDLFNNYPNQADFPHSIWKVTSALYAQKVLAHGANRRGKMHRDVVMYQDAVRQGSVFDDVEFPSILHLYVMGRRSGLAANFLTLHLRIFQGCNSLLSESRREVEAWKSEVVRVCGEAEGTKCIEAERLRPLAFKDDAACACPGKAAAACAKFSFGDDFLCHNTMNDKKICDGAQYIALKKAKLVPMMLNLGLWPDENSVDATELGWLHDLLGSVLVGDFLYFGDNTCPL